MDRSKGHLNFTLKVKVKRTNMRHESLLCGNEIEWKTMNTDIRGVLPVNHQISVHCDHHQAVNRPQTKKST